MIKYRKYYARKGMHGVDNVSFSFSKFCILILPFEEILSSLLKIYLADEEAT